MRNALLALALVGTLAACNSATLSDNINAANTDLATAQADVAKAAQFWGVAKGIAQVALVSDPTLAAKLAPAIATIDSLVASAQAASVAVGATAPAIEALVVQINTQAASVATTAAPVIKVVKGV